MKPMLKNSSPLPTFVLTLSLATSACVSSPQETNDNSSEVLGVAPVKPAQIGEDECVNYVQLERNADYQCELANGETRPMREGERRTAPLTKEEIVEIIDRNADDTDSCIDEAERRDPKAKGKIVINFEVEPNGQISEAHVVSEKSSYKDTTAAKCLVSKVKTWRFPVLHNADALEIKFPFEFGEDSARNELQAEPNTNTEETVSPSPTPESNETSQKEVPNKMTIKKTRKK
jgi:hypothetical protein